MKFIILMALLLTVVSSYYTPPALKAIGIYYDKLDESEVKKIESINRDIKNTRNEISSEEKEMGSTIKRLKSITQNLREGLSQTKEGVSKSVGQAMIQLEKIDNKQPDFEKRLSASRLYAISPKSSGRSKLLSIKQLQLNI